MTMIETATTRQARRIRFQRWARSLLAGAVGDAWGYQIEPLSMAAIRAAHGPAGMDLPRIGRLVVSDDTQLTLFILEGVLDVLRARQATPAGLDDTAVLDRLRIACLDWYTTQFGIEAHRPIGDLAGMDVLRHLRTPDATFLTAFADGGKGTPEHPANDSAGAGGAVRIAAIPLLAATPTDACRLAARHAASTHGHLDGYGAAGFLAALLWRLCDGAAPMEAAVAALGDLSMFAMRLPPARRPPTEPYQHALALAGAPGSGTSLPASLGRGRTGAEAVAIGLWAALQAETLIDSLRIAVNHDGGSSSTGSIAGQIRAAAGIDAPIPAVWATALDVAPVLSVLLRRAEELIVATGPEYGQMSSAGVAEYPGAIPEESG